MELTKDEVNKIIHEEIMGECWHEWHSPGLPHHPGVKVCQKCDYYPNVAMLPPNPDYCSDDSPRSLLNEVVAKVGDATYVEYENSGLERALITAIKDWRSEVALCQPANVIARACVEAWRSK